MCSISGIFTISKTQESFEQSKHLAVTCVRKMNAALRHRGPDDDGIVEIVDASHDSKSHVSLVLGNTRLAILDRSRAGHQPMRGPKSGDCLTYNGETYNFRNLRDELDADDIEWTSKTDTEVVLRAYEKWGRPALSKLRGMFALGIWDEGSKQLTLARDRFGIKPLYYSIVTEPDAKHFIFASEVRALLATGLIPRKLSSKGVASFLAYGSVQSPYTIVEDVKSLHAGELLRVRVRSGEFIVDCEALSPMPITTVPNSRCEALERLRHELEDSVRVHLESDVPLGFFLSGGMDSSALMALTRTVTREALNTFSVVFEEKAFTEATQARFVADKFHTRHSEITLTEDDLLSDLPFALASFDQPTVDGVNSYVVSKAVKNAGITVALSGLGGDELFAGYPSFSRALKLNSFSPLARSLVRATANVGNFALKNSVKGRKLSQFMTSEMSPNDVYEISRQLFSSGEADQISSLRFTSPNGYAGAKETGEAEADTDLINAISKLEMNGYMANTLLRDTDSTSMASSLEVRVPFVDSLLVGYVLKLPGEWKIDNARPKLPKPLLADAVADLLPQSFLNRPKMGFTLPFEKWMLGRLRNEVGQMLLDRSSVETSGLNPEATDSLWQRFLSSPSSVGWSRPWALYALAKWCELHNVRM